MFPSRVYYFVVQSPAKAALAFTGTARLEQRMLRQSHLLASKEALSRGLSASELASCGSSGQGGKSAPDRLMCWIPAALPAPSRTADPSASARNRTSLLQASWFIYEAVCKIIGQLLVLEFCSCVPLPCVLGVGGGWWGCVSAAAASAEKGK